MYKYFLAFALALVTVKSEAQDASNKFRTDLIKPSPTAANLGKYGDLPVTMYTGQANISVPVYTVQGRECSLPITLTYNYNGFRPYDQISWVGMGWSLQAGGVITRQIKGNPDGTMDPGKNYDDVKDSLAVVTVSQNILKQTGADALYDLEPDIFSFNFDGNSGKFIVVNNVIYVFSESNVKIEGNSVGGFKITTPNGICYEFYEAEITRQKAITGSARIFGDYVSAWYLTKISSPAKTEQIVLKYVDEGQLIQGGVMSQSYQRSNEVIEDPSVYFSSPLPILSPVETNIQSKVNCKRLVSITFDQGKVLFLPENNPRQDLLSSTASFYALGKIKVINIKGNVLKEYSLVHDYIDATASKYLRLKSFSENGINQNISNTHSFEYVEGVFPSKYAAGTDHYGYYNGNTSFNLIPEKIVDGSYVIDVCPNGADREPVFSRARLGALSKIIYPTGGNVELFYESNQLQTNGYKTIYHEFGKRIQRLDSITDNQIDSIGHFSLNTAQKINVWYNRSGKAEISADSIARENKISEIKIFKIEGSVLTLVASIPPYRSAIPVGTTEVINLPLGEYEYRLTCDAKENDVEVLFSYSSPTNDPSENPAHGIRIQKIVQNPLSGQPITTKYSYSRGEGNGPSSYDIKIVDKYFLVGSSISAANNTIVSNKFTVYTSNFTEGPPDEIPYFYGKVTELVGNGLDTLKTEHYFDIYNALISFSGVREKQKIAYKYTDGLYTPITKTTYDYVPLVTGYATGVRPYKLQINEPNYLTFYNYDSYNLIAGRLAQSSSTDILYNGTSAVTATNNNYYNNVSLNLSRVESSTSTPGQSIVTKYKYPGDYTTSAEMDLATANFNVPVETQVWKKRSVTDSILVSGLINQFDYASKKPLKVYAFEKNGTAASLGNEQYSSTLKKYASLISDPNYKERVSYSYDTQGNLTSQQKTSGTFVSYKWGYKAIDPLTGSFSNTNMLFPLAEVENATAAEFYLENFEDSMLADSTSGAHTGKKCSSSNVISWTPPNGRSYVISYWYKVGAIWKFSQEQSYTTSSFTMTGGSLYDDVRIYPRDAQMKSYTYEPIIGVTSMTDAKSQTTYYEYDAFQRLNAIKDQDGNIVKHYDYHYQNQ